MKPEWPIEGCRCSSGLDDGNLNYIGSVREESGFCMLSR